LLERTFATISRASFRTVGDVDDIGTRRVPFHAGHGEMRITGGTARGRTIRAPRGRAIRPTSDKVRAAIFNSIEARYGVEGRRVADLFCGTGALGIEALSRGAAHVTFVDESLEARRLTEANLASIRPGGTSAVVGARLPAGVERLRGSAPFGGVLVDPPYDLEIGGTMLAALESAGLLEPDAWIVIEHRRGLGLPEAVGGYRRELLRRHGDTEISIYCGGGDV
jgi:16S rRNA (guanine966-N2)-methyltransferase